MKKTMIAVLMLLPMTGFAAGFDCAKAGTRIEHMICDNPELDKLDEEMTLMYRGLSRGPDALQIQKEQREWNKSRNAAQTPAELAQMYEDRMSELAEGKPAERVVETSKPTKTPVRMTDQQSYAVGVLMTMFAGTDVCNEKYLLTEYSSEGISAMKADIKKELKETMGKFYDKDKVHQVYLATYRMLKSANAIDLHSVCQTMVIPTLVKYDSNNIENQF